MGQVEEERLNLNTSFPADELSSKWAALLADFRALLNSQVQAFHVAAARGDSEPAHLVAKCLQAARHRWLRTPYVPSAEPLAEAWSSRLASEETGA